MQDILLRVEVGGTENRRGSGQEDEAMTQSSIV